jgi:hypothetical protein
MAFPEMRSRVTYDTERRAALITAAQWQRLRPLAMF